VPVVIALAAFLAACAPSPETGPTTSTVAPVTEGSVVLTSSTMAIIGDSAQVPHAIAALATAGILGTDEIDWALKKEYVTGGQLTACLARALGLQDGALNKAGLLSDTEGSSFQPEERVSRQQATLWIIGCLSYEAEHDPSLSQAQRLSFTESADAWLGAFQDRSLIDPACARAVANGYRLGIIDAAEGGWFYPTLPVSWGDLSIWLERAFTQPVKVRESPPGAVPSLAKLPSAKLKSEGPMVWYLEYQLTALNYRPGPVDGVYDNRTADAVMAFEKVERLHRDGVASDAVWQRITTAQTPIPKLVADGTRVEIDLTRQVLFMITDNKIWKIIHVSTGRSRGTPAGPGRVGTKQPGWVAVRVGRMYYVSYIRPHIAIHGSASVPSHPASHGCIRVPKWMAVELFYELPVGTRVDVYYR
jgi:peptidoglycan hydrolase-like protein with peptidoglycan-binding domain